MRLYCDNSSTQLRYFHVNLDSRILGTQVRAVNYFAKLDGPTFVAWGARGLTSVSQTVRPGNPTCQGYNTISGPPDVFFFVPER